jgi:hypothetical protein
MTGGAGWVTWLPIPSEKGSTPCWFWELGPYGGIETTVFSMECLQGYQQHLPWLWMKQELGWCMAGAKRLSLLASGGPGTVS